MLAGLSRNTKVRNTPRWNLAVGGCEGEGVGAPGPKAAGLLSSAVQVPGWGGAGGPAGHFPAISRSPWFRREDEKTPGGSPGIKKVLSAADILQALHDADIALP